jgi:hypothetical protein
MIAGVRFPQAQLYGGNPKRQWEKPRIRSGAEYGDQMMTVTTGRRLPTALEYCGRTVAQLRCPENAHR